MGVNGLWKLLEPVGRPVTLESLENKTLAVDISVWLNQALYGMKNQHGSAFPNAHLVLLFQRICKLLFYKVKPIFVFDGGVPELKKKTMAARREFRLSAHRKASKLSEKVLRKYIKAHVIGNITGRTSHKSTDILKETEAERDLFQLSPLPEEKELKSSSEDELFSHTQHFQDVEGVDIDSEDFRKLPPEVQHEIIVEMHEKNKRHSRYQAIDMPEESNEFSNFQLDHLLKRGKLTQRLGTIRKEMNERRVGDLVVDIAENGIEGYSAIQSQKIMSEESGHYILIKRSEPSKNEDEDAAEDTMAGGFFRENFDDVQDEKPFILPNLPRVSERVAQPSVSCALDDKASSTDDGSSIGQDSRDVADLLVLSPTKTAQRNFCSPGNSVVADPRLVCHTAEKSRQKSEHSMEVIIVEPFSTQESKNTDNEIAQASEIEDASMEKVKENTELNNVPVAEEVTSPEASSTHPDQLKTNSQNSIRDISPQISHEPQNTLVATSFETDRDLDDFEDEIKQRKMLIEKLLSTRTNSVLGRRLNMGNEGEHSVVESEISGNSLGSGDDSQNFSRVSRVDESGSSESVDEEKDVNPTDKTEAVGPSTSHSSRNTGTEPDVDQSLPVLMPESVGESQPVINEFEGVSYEDLEEMQERLNEDLDNLKEERSRQNRLAATVSDEMYKDSQELLQLFGIPFVVSPMEAEAQCATLNTKNLCEGSITEDSDIVLFGGRNVYKNVFNQNKNAELYQEDDVKNVLGLDRHALITIALLTGSDYTEGVQGIGVVSAMEIIQEFPGEGINKLENLKKWFNETKKQGNSSQESKLKNKLRNISLPAGFPSQQVFEAYLHPAVDDSNEPFSWENPDLHGLRLFASEKMGWSKSRTDEVLLPVLKRLNSSEFNQTKKIKSRRVKRVVNRLLNKELDEENSTRKKRKVNPSARKRKNTHSDKRTKSFEHESHHFQRESASNEKTVEEKVEEDASPEKASLPTLGLNNKNNSSTDSTSDTSDEDTSYVPFKKVTAQVRGRASSRRSRGTRSKTNR